MASASAMYRFAGVIILSSAALAQTAQQAEVAVAAKSPTVLARYLELHKTVDWKVLRSSLHLPQSEDWLAPCGGDFPAAEAPCSAETALVANPEQAIVIIRGDDLSHTVEYLRYLRAKSGWKFAGENSAFIKNGPSRHEIIRVGGKPFLKITSNHSEFGVGIRQEVEDWFDLTQPDLNPVFSFTIEGGQDRFGFGVSRNIHAQSSFSQASGLETIDLSLVVNFDGPALNLEAIYLGIYDRLPHANKFALRIAYSDLDRRTIIPTKDFEELADPAGGPSNEKLLVYALSGLQKVATGSNPEAREWLQLILSNTEDTPEKRSLLELLAKP